MEIELKIDYNGEPYIQLYAGDYKTDTKQDLLKLFIRKAKTQGIVIKDEHEEDYSDDYARIQLRRATNDH